MVVAESMKDSVLIDTEKGMVGLLVGSTELLVVASTVVIVLVEDSICRSVVVSIDSVVVLVLGLGTECYVSIYLDTFFSNVNRASNNV